MLCYNRPENAISFFLSKTKFFSGSPNVRARINIQCGCTWAFS